MNIADIVLTIMLLTLCARGIVSMKKGKKKGCSKDCTSCNNRCR